MRQEEAMEGLLCQVEGVSLVPLDCWEHWRNFELRVEWGDWCLKLLTLASEIDIRRPERRW